MKQIHWFPGHMVKALKEMEARIKLVDIVIELVDARAPLSSRNPEIARLIQQKPALILLTKKDLADDHQTRKWIDYFLSQDKSAYAVNIKQMDYALIKRQAQMVLKDKFAKEAAKGLRPRPIRALICGIPNVGKSTFINQLAKRKATRVGNRPGITTAQQWIKVEEDFELLDTPGVLWPNFEDKAIGVKLALLGTIKADILPKDILTRRLLTFLTTHYARNLYERFHLDVPLVTDQATFESALEKIGRKRGILKQKDQVDYEQTMTMLLKEFADGKIGRFTLDGKDDGLWTN